MPSRPRTLVDEEIAKRLPRDEPILATYKLGVDLTPCIFDCNRSTTRPDSICEAHDLDPGGPLWGKALTVEQVRQENQRIRWYRD